VKNIILILLVGKCIIQKRLEIGLQKTQIVSTEKIQD